MNVFALNAAPLNAAGVIAQYVYLPSTSVGITVDLTENRAVSMSASSGLAIDTAGQIVAVAQLGTGTGTLSIDSTGVLTKLTAVALGAVSETITTTESVVISRLTLVNSATDSISLGATGALSMTGGLSTDETLDITPTATMTNKVVMAAAETITVYDSPTLTRVGTMALNDTIVLAASADLSVGVRSYMSVNDAILFTESADLIRYARVLMSANETLTFSEAVELSRFAFSYLPDATGSIVVTDDASLRLTGRLSGSGGIVMTDVAALNRMVQIGALSDSAFLNVVGSLSNNATEQDLPENTMRRPFNDRTMARVA